MGQTSFFSGEELRDSGMKRVLDNADEQIPQWSHFAYNFLLTYIKDNKEFMVEEVRLASEDHIPPPPSARAWGGIIVKAVKSGLVRRSGFRNVKNAKAHCTPASVWEVI